MEGKYFILTGGTEEEQHKSEAIASSLIFCIGIIAGIFLVIAIIIQSSFLGISSFAVGFICSAYEYECPVGQNCTLCKLEIGGQDAGNG